MKTRSFSVLLSTLFMLTGFCIPVFSSTSSAPQPANILPQDIRLCTSFCLDNGDHCVFGANLDYDVKVSQVFVNKRGVLKTSWEPSTTGDYARWISKYGSVTINLAGYQLAWAGMNEAGLMISTMALMDTVQPDPDERPALPSPLWVQYQLDNFSNIEEVIASDTLIRVTNAGDHYLVCDRTGACAVIEFLEGKMVAHTGTSLPVKALANSTYQDSLTTLRDADYWKLGVFRVKTSGPAHDAGILADDRILMVDGVEMTGEDAIKNFFSILAEHGPGDDLNFTVLHAGDIDPVTATLKLGPLPEDLSKYTLPPGVPIQVLSLGFAPSFTGNYLVRFATAAEWVEAFEPSNSGNAVAYAFDALGAVSEDDTVFSVVFNPVQLRIYFRSYLNPQIRYLDFNELCFSCIAPVMMLDIHAAGNGNMSSSLVEYSHKMALDYMLAVLPRWTNMPPIGIETILTGLENSPCMEDNSYAVSNPDAYLRDHPSWIPPLATWISLMVFNHAWWVWLLLTLLSLVFTVWQLYRRQEKNRGMWLVWIPVVILLGLPGLLAFLLHCQRYRRTLGSADFRGA